MRRWWRGFGVGRARSCLCPTEGEVLYTVYDMMIGFFCNLVLTTIRVGNLMIKQVVPKDTPRGSKEKEKQSGRGRVQRQTGVEEDKTKRFRVM